MIWSYSYIETVHSKLNEYILEFFNKIKDDTAGFRDELFNSDFLQIVNRHPSILKKRLRIVYNYLNTLPAKDRELLCDEIKFANQIEKICQGEYKPKTFDQSVQGIDKIIKDFFLSLYDQVLDGDPFRELNNTNLRAHFNQFSNANENIILCPFCGISFLKKSGDTIRDQYDHYLPKSLYPFSAVNFQNLVLTCRECNSLDVKANKDILALSVGKIFFPFDKSHKSIHLQINVVKDNAKIELIEWQIIFSSSDNKKDEIESWKKIYKIEDRYKGHIKSQVKSWYECYFDVITSSKLEGCSIEDIKRIYSITLATKQKQKSDYIQKPVFDALLADSNIMQAQIEASKYT
ncbi:MAG: hypothetical protein CK427_17150 [Leptospira sp.]|nr:MAG: hypothetical protein CK427_17150 [Leptospira sp.]